MRPFLVRLGGLVLVLGWAVPLAEGGSVNLPLNNLRHFSVNRDWVYDAAEKVALAGLVEPQVLNTKPWSRREVARMVLEALERIERDDPAVAQDPTGIEFHLLRLREELAEEVAALKGVGSPSRLRPLEFVHVGGAFTDEQARPGNRQGESLEEGGNGRLTAAGWGVWRETAAVYVRPEGTVNEETSRFRLGETYVKVERWNVELEVGRDNLWWGPGFHGALILSNNARPLDMVKLASAEAFVLPWIFRYLGPFKVTWFLGQLEEDRDFPRAKVSGLRLNIAPASWVEVGLSRVIQFGGEGRPSPRVEDIPCLFVACRSTREGGADNGTNNNEVYGLDVAFVIRGVDRLVPVARTVQVYAEYGFEDLGTPESAPPYPKHGSVLVGLYLPDLFLSAQSDLRVEYAHLGRPWYTHSIYTSGFTLDGRVLGHQIGGDAESLYVRTTRWLTEAWHLGLEAEYRRRGIDPLPATERTLAFGLDTSYAWSDKLSVFTGYRLSLVENRDFQPRGTDLDHLVRLEFTYRF
ncbi:MAG: capsule assembly Wzi family protein [Candidatus Methylomirabilales bacterium]